MENEYTEGRQSIGKYTVVGRLGQGGEGCVYLGHDETLGRPVAIKELRGAQREAELLKSLKHPMLPVVYEMVQDHAWYMVMEYVEGVTLREYIERNGAAGEEELRAWAVQLLDVLAYLHTIKPPVIYRDLKPDNIMICLDGHLRLVDFGAADRRRFGAQESSMMAVTPGYGAPEQLGMGYFGETGAMTDGVQGPVAGVYADERSDLYAFGKVLYYAATGIDPAKPPYTLLSIGGYCPLLSDSMERIIGRCIEEDPARRYQSAGEIRADLYGGGRRRRLRRRSFVRAVEKSIWLTEME